MTELHSILTISLYFVLCFYEDYSQHRFILRSYNDTRITGYYLLGIYCELDTVLMLSLCIINGEYNIPNEWSLRAKHLI